ncbi:MAG: bifunctional adenosylcobinamide kinase/adenosylcobinamide-phosphate guanylyltransferase [Deferrisomatales bacterium]|nr:bifunctional adenosylcobinamide kinase/adenosylcobinamide-phosphate guanylyltransferase [Deferrisomatales bacterium]
MENTERRLVFVTGGTRSGKSGFAQGLVEGWPGQLLYIATAEVRDAEMRCRVDLHQQDRGPRWHTREEPLDLPAALAAAQGYGGVLLDCLTLWTSNLMESHGDDEAAIDQAVGALLDALAAYPGRLCVVTNEVGSGIVPEHPLARRFRDRAGRINQQVAASATEAYLVVSGLPVCLKPRSG